ncbi:MAG: type III pantothenate kinase [Bacteroidales bacterium]|nr:type III pantothenate kinase [Bacteroidales bacterium]MDD4602553.1 type III pantothenate kinase [Bacteroidales bacterium]
MDLILDFGNTNKKLAIFNDDKLVELVQYSDISLTQVRNFVNDHPGIENCILSSVIHHPVSINRYLASHFHFLELTALTPLPIKNRYHSGETLGKDRLAAAVAGAMRFPGQEVLVINAGTCITYDFINRRQEYIGGAISPGLEMRFRALHTFTRKLPLINFRDSLILVGKNTEESILSGVLSGTIAEIEGITARYRKNNPSLKILLSGGDVKYFDKQLKISIFALPNIVIYGLQKILLFNVDKVT